MIKIGIITQLDKLWHLDRSDGYDTSLKDDLAFTKANLIMAMNPLYIQGFATKCIPEPRKIVNKHDVIAAGMFMDIIKLDIVDFYHNSLFNKVESFYISRLVGQFLWNSKQTDVVPNLKYHQVKKQSDFTNTVIDLREENKKRKYKTYDLVNDDLKLKDVVIEVYGEDILDETRYLPVPANPQHAGGTGYHSYEPQGYSGAGH